MISEYDPIRIDVRSRADVDEWVLPSASVMRRDWADDSATSECLATNAELTKQLVAPQSKRNTAGWLATVPLILMRARVIVVTWLTSGRTEVTTMGEEWEDEGRGDGEEEGESEEEDDDEEGADDSDGDGSDNCNNDDGAMMTAWLFFSEIDGPSKAANRFLIDRGIAAMLRNLTSPYSYIHERHDLSVCISNSGSQHDNDRSQIDSRSVHDYSSA